MIPRAYYSDENSPRTIDIQDQEQERMDEVKAREYELDDGHIVLSTEVCYGGVWNIVLFREITKDYKGEPDSKIIQIGAEYTDDFPPDNKGAEMLVDFVCRRASGDGGGLRGWDGSDWN